MNVERLNNLSRSINNNNALEKTYDDLEEEKKRLEEEMEEFDEFELSNKYKTRIIDAEINSILPLQILIYFNFCYFFVCFALEMSSICFKIYIMTHNSIRWIKFALEFVFLIIESPLIHYSVSESLPAHPPPCQSFPEHKTLC